MTAPVIQQPLLKQAFDAAVNLHWRLAGDNPRLSPEDSLLVFADPRGGSTWLAETLSAELDTELLWEPLQIRLVEDFNRLHFFWRQYIPRDAEWPEAEESFRRLLSGAIRNNHVCRKTTLWALKRAEQIMIKFCRGNMLLPWVVERFSPKRPPVLLIRHPFSVVSSKLDHGNWDFEYEKLRVPDTPFNDRYSEHEQYLLSLETKAEMLVASWCITNMVPLSDPQNNREWITVHYEHLITEPERELRRIFERWELPFPESVLSTVRRPSSTTKDDTFRSSISRQLSKWDRRFTPEQIERLEAVLDHFNVAIYSADPMPRM